MDNNFLEELINEARNREGGLILNFNEKPEVVVLTIEKYNQLLGTSAHAQISPLPNQDAVRPGPGFSGNNSRKILVTGGAGYIGSHLVLELIKAGYEVVVFDNLSYGKKENVPAEAAFIEGDLADTNFLRDVFAANNFYAVMHMAASVEVEESVHNPEKYFENNAINTAKLLSVMKEAGVNNIIFSSTAAVYGEQQQNPISENAGLKPNNPYGYSKLLAEKIIRYYSSYLGFTAVVFRYFNASGANFDGKIKPTHHTHLIPIVLQVAKGERTAITVYGSDYNTPDRTCERDYVHVLDIASAHIAALGQLDPNQPFRVYNIGTGKGLSVLEVINCASETLNKMIPIQMGPRRAGDPEKLVADKTKIAKELGFTPKFSDTETIIKTAWAQLYS